MTRQATKKGTGPFSESDRLLGFDDLRPEIVNRLLFDLFSAGEGEGRRKTRASALNLVILARERSAGELHEHLYEVTGRLPSRVVLVLVRDEDGGPEDVRAGVSALCRLGGPSEQICCEIIGISTPASVPPELAGTVSSLLIADLPSAFWLRDDSEAAGSFAAEFSRHADGTLFDLARGSGSPAERIARAIRAAAGAGAAGDVLWTRIAPWRDAVARLFDGPTCPACLMRIRTVEVRGEGPAGEAAGWEMAGWLGSRLGWRLERRSARVGEFRSTGDGRRVAVEFRPAEKGTGHILRGCRIETDGPDGSAVTFSVERVEEGDRVHTRFEVPGTCPLPECFDLPEPVESDAVVNALLALGADDAFRDAMRALEPAWPEGEAS